MSLAADAITLAYPGRRLCESLAFSVEPGQCWGMLGNNGSGKTTLLHTLAGIHRPQAGVVRLDGQPLGGLPARARALRIGLLLQEEQIEFYGSVLDYVCLGRYPHRAGLTRGEDDERIARAQLEKLGLTAFADRSLNSLSGGERQRARLAQALTQDPNYYLLDEPLQHLDLRHQLQVLALFGATARSERRGVVMVMHDPRLVLTCCDHALLLYEDGPPLAGAAASVLTGETLERLYGVPVPL